MLRGADVPSSSHGCARQEPGPCPAAGVTFANRSVAVSPAAKAGMGLAGDILPFLRLLSVPQLLCFGTLGTAVGGSWGFSHHRLLCGSVGSEMGPIIGFPYR